MFTQVISALSEVKRRFLNSAYKWPTSKKVNKPSLDFRVYLSGKEKENITKFICLHPYKLLKITCQSDIFWGNM